MADQPEPWRHVPASSAQYHNVAFAGVSLTPNSMMNSEDEKPPQNVIRLRMPRVETPRRIIDDSMAAVRSNGAMDGVRRPRGEMAGADRCWRHR